MQLKITAKNLATVVKKIENSEFKSLAKDFRSVSIWGQTDALKVFDISFAPTVEFLDFLMGILESLDDFKATHWLSVQKALFVSGNDVKIKSTRTFVTQMTRYMTENIIDGWLYKRTPHGAFPYLVTEITKVSSNPRLGITAGVKIQTSCCTPQEDKPVSRGEIFLSLDEIRGKSLIQILATRGYMKETPELKADYLKAMEQYQEYQGKFGTQFLLNGRSQNTGRYEDARTFRNVKVVNNEKVSEGEIIEKIAVPLFRGVITSSDDEELYCYLEDEMDNLEDIEGLDKEEALEDLDVKDDHDLYEVKMLPLPYHPLIRVFNLDAHSDQWTSSMTLTPYVYDKTVEDKLVLPQEHRDLIDVLVKDSEIVLDDIVMGKSGGTIILGKGKPGLGKTLTAEVYSEIVGKPLYRVHSGQLGTDPDNMDKKLRSIIERSESWNAILLIDEADVFIRSRGNDIMHNSIVASFLRQLEMMDGVLFLTTNRSDDVDDAILSRCSSIIEYKHPEREDSLKIWKILETNYGIGMSDELIGAAHKMYPKASGRDIKEIIKLCARFKSKDYVIDEDRLRICGMFRGMHANIASS